MTHNDAPTRNNSVLHFGALHGRSRYQAAKSLAQDPSIIIFDEPTRGVDVETIREIHAEIRSLADEGKAVVVISSYLPEVLAVSDLILVARLGRIVAEFAGGTATEDKIMSPRRSSALLVNGARSPRQTATAI
jgi:ABC-type multidrug transport system ATPase subunit